MKINKETITQLAQLAKLEFDEGIKEKLANDLGDILAYVEQLQMVKIDNEVITFTVNDLENVWRDDYVEAIDEDVKEKIKDNLTEAEDDYIKVKRIL
jgi:aspartyl-tRNA(Asn)/glutamyl-tRNA(Gln) amidotransferase subunit C